MMAESRFLILACTIAFTQPAAAQPQLAIIKFAPGVTADQISEFKSGKKADEIAKIGDGSTYVFRFPDKASAAIPPSALVTLARSVTGSFSNIFQPASLAGADVPAAISARVTRIANDPRTERVSVVTLNAGQFSLDLLRDAVVLAADPAQTNAPVRLNIVEGLNIDAYKTGSAQTGPASFRWSGTLRASVPIAPGADAPAVSSGDAQLSISGDKITGRVVIGSDVYRIDPLSNGLHAIVKINQSRFPPEHPYEPEYRKPEKPKPASDAKPAGADAPVPLVGVGIVYSSTATLQLGEDGLAAFSAALRDSLNGALERSGIFGSIQLRGSTKVELTEDDFDSVLGRLRESNPLSAPYVEIKAWKAQTRSHILVVMTTMDSYCGLASHILANDSPAVAIVNVGCALDNLSFAHELGHLLGARHNPEIDATNVPYAYGHGRLFSSTRSIMSYAGAGCAGSCPRIPYFVGPNVQLNGQILGNDEQYNDARAIAESFPTVSQLSP